MKKKYIIPQTSVFAIGITECILSGSTDPQIILSGNASEGEDLGREDNSVSNVWDSEW